MSDPLINITIPVYNEERVLALSIGKLVNFLEMNCPYRYEVVIANNGSTDGTLESAREIEAEYEKVRVVDVQQKGRGGALRTVWEQSDADILTYMDVDLSTDLEAFPELIGAVATPLHGYKVTRLHGSKEL